MEYSQPLIGLVLVVVLIAAFIRIAPKAGDPNDPDQGICFLLCLVFFPLAWIAWIILMVLPDLAQTSTDHRDRTSEDDSRSTRAKDDDYERLRERILGRRRR
jgi:hypothetical protein